MARIVHSTDSVRLVPIAEQEKPAADQVAYRVRPPAVFERPKFDRAVRAAGAVNRGEIGLLDCLAEGVEALLPDAADAAIRQEHLDQIAAYRGRIVEEGYPALVAGSPAVTRIADEVRRGYQRYRDFESDNDYYWEVQGLIAAQLFVESWENLPGEVERVSGEMTEASLAKIPRGHFFEIGVSVAGLMRPGETDLKNSDSPSPGSPSPDSSISTASE